MAKQLYATGMRTQASSYFLTFCITTVTKFFITITAKQPISRKIKVLLSLLQRQRMIEVLVEKTCQSNGARPLMLGYLPLML